MKSILFVLPILVAFIFGSATFAFAESTYTIVIPSGASDPSSPYYWSEKSTGVATGEITIYPGDTVTWENADSAFHTITSVTKSGEIDGIFDSSFIKSGDLILNNLQNWGIFTIFVIIIIHG